MLRTIIKIRFNSKKNSSGTKILKSFLIFFLILSPHDDAKCIFLAVIGLAVYKLDNFSS